MLLNKLFDNAPEIEINELSIDSRVNMKDAIFFCLSGIKYNGHDYIDEAINNGAKVIVYSDDIKKSGKAIYIKVSNVSETLSRIADIFYDYPNKDIYQYVVSGNYGKSSVATFINSYLNNYLKCGYVGIFGINYADKHVATLFSTLTALENIKLVKSFKDNGIKACTFEATASALNLKKLDIIKPNIFVYTCTNTLGSEYSNDYYSYIRRYLYTLDNNTKVIFNIDDESFEELNDSIDNYVTYGRSLNADYCISNIRVSRRGINYKLTHNNIDYEIESKLLSVANVYNLTAAIVALNESGYEIEDIICKAKEFDCIDGVLESIDDEYNIIIDDAYDLKNIENLCDFASNCYKGKTYAVIGINYSDDDERLSKLITILEQYVDTVILTEDESLEGEIETILNRTNKFIKKNIFVHCGFRSLAIENGINMLNKDDVLLIIGKGNEKYLSMAMGKSHYNGDKFYAKKMIKTLKNQ